MDKTLKDQMYDQFSRRRHQTFKHHKHTTFHALQNQHRSWLCHKISSFARPGQLETRSFWIFQVSWTERKYFQQTCCCSHISYRPSLDVASPWSDQSRLGVARWRWFDWTAATNIVGMVSVFKFSSNQFAINHDQVSFFTQASSL